MGIYSQVEEGSIVIDPPLTEEQAIKVLEDVIEGLRKNNKEEYGFVKKSERGISDYSKIIGIYKTWWNEDTISVTQWKKFKESNHEFTLSDGKKYYWEKSKNGEPRTFNEITIDYGGFVAVNQVNQMIDLLRKNGFDVYGELTLSVTTTYDGLQSYCTKWCVPKDGFLQQVMEQKNADVTTEDSEYEFTGSPSFASPRFITEDSPKKITAVDKSGEPYLSFTAFTEN